jgi:TRAP-type mannitol/chloroaromatic compound transport system substrate-binding protein
VGPYNDLAFGLHQVAKYYYYPGWQEPGPTLEVIVNQDAWNELPADLREIVEVASLAMNTDMLAEYTARNNAALTELVEVHGADVRRLPDDVIAELKRISLQATDELVDESDPLQKRIYDSYVTFRDNVIAYHEISERAYINTRDPARAAPK